MNKRPKGGMVPLWPLLWDSFLVMLLFDIWTPSPFGCIIMRNSLLELEQNDHFVNVFWARIILWPSIGWREPLPAKVAMPNRLSCLAGPKASHIMVSSRAIHIPYFGLGLCLWWEKLSFISPPNPISSSNRHNDHLLKQQSESLDQNISCSSWIHTELKNQNTDWLEKGQVNIQSTCWANRRKVLGISYLVKQKLYYKLQLRW